MITEYILIAISAIVILGVFILMYISGEIKRTFKKEVEIGLVHSSSLEDRKITENDMENLPDLIKNYLNYVGVVGSEKVHSIMWVSLIDADLGPGKGRVKMKTTEYNFYGENPRRLALMEFFLKGIPVVGLDSYVEKKGRMLMKPAGIFTAVDEKGHHMDDTSALVLHFLSMCTGAPSTLIDDRIQWTTIDSSSVKAVFSDGGCAITAVLKFDEEGALIDFSTEDKYYNPDGKCYQKVRWSTPILNYKKINGLMLSTYGEATWHFQDQDSVYGKNTLLDIKYNVKGLDKN